VYFCALGMLDSSIVMTGPWYLSHICTPMTLHR
jgi:hypothetical protein